MKKKTKHILSKVLLACAAITICYTPFALIILKTKGFLVMSFLVLWAVLSIAVSVLLAIIVDKLDNKYNESLK